MFIYGAGMAGLLAAQMLRRYAPVVCEAQPDLPDNHGALLRFRSTVVQEATGIPFQEVHVTKAAKVGGELRTSATLREANQYSFKVAGEVMPRSVMSLAPVTRYVAPDDFLATMARGAQLQLGTPLTREELLFRRGDPTTPVAISTIPLPVMLRLLGVEDRPEFRWRPIWSANVTLTAPLTRVYQTIYYPGAAEPYYRASFTGNRLTLEYAEEPTAATADARHVLGDFGLEPRVVSWDAAPVVRRQEYGKLLPIDDRQRRALILALTDQYRIYSVGRFATWRQLLLDDVVNDVRVVARFIAERGDAYARNLHSVVPA